MGIETGNRWRWKARKELAEAVKKHEASIREFAKQEDKFLLNETAQFAKKLLRVILHPSPVNKVKSAIGMADYIRMLANYNDTMEIRYQRHIKLSLLTLENASDKVQHMEDGFKALVAKYQRKKCGNLFSSYFNQPSDLRF